MADDWPTMEQAEATVVEALLEERFEVRLEFAEDLAHCAVEALRGAAMLWTADRYDEDCHACERPVRDHLVDGRHPEGAEVG